MSVASVLQCCAARMRSGISAWGGLGCSVIFTIGSDMCMGGACTIKSSVYEVWEESMWTHRRRGCIVITRMDVERERGGGRGKGGGGQT